MKIPELDRVIGMLTYGTNTPGVGGVLRTLDEDFIVEEVHSEEFDGESRKRYVVFTLEKKNLDTMTAVAKLSNVLKVDPRFFSFAGLKDKRAITYQKICVQYVSPDELKKVSIPGIKIKDIKYSRKPIGLGDLLGNYFKIKLRHLSDGNLISKVNSTLNEINSIGGVPNFFGYQRFGVSRPITHIIGREIVKKNFEAAVIVYLTHFSAGEAEYLADLKLDIKINRDFKKALEKYPRNLVYERRILKHLSRKPEDFIGAIKTLPPRLILLFVHAYQAYLFNLMLSMRIIKGIPINQPVEGDIVKISDHPFPKFLKVSSSNIKTLLNKRERDKCKIVLPLIGYSSKLPEGEMQDIINEILKREQISLKDFYIRELPKASSSGEYREILMSPTNLQIHGPMKDDLNPTKLMLIFEFFLTKGCYATVLLREFMKSSDPLKAGY
ncbi:MAG: tRNA pseudouridine(13) synthase TruD [Candidatus Odinarchaeia archaeon]